MTRDGIAYVKALLNTDESSAGHEIGWKVWMTPGREAILDYLTSVMQEHAPGSRAFEIAYEIWLLLGGRGVAA